jgi:hypothetical protein
MKDTYGYGTEPETSLHRDTDQQTAYYLQFDVVNKQTMFCETNSLST